MKTIGDKLGRVAGLVEGWSETGRVDELERDLALGLLRDVYAELKFAQRGDIATIIAPGDRAAKVGKCGTAVMIGSEGRVGGAAEPSAAESFGAESFAIELSAAGSPAAESHSREPDGVGEIIARRKVTPEVIRSLYGEEPDDRDEDCPAPGEPSENGAVTATETEAGHEAYVKTEPAAETELETETVTETEATFDAEQKVKQHPETGSDAATEHETGHRPPVETPPGTERESRPGSKYHPEPAAETKSGGKPTLGDTLSAGRQTIGDTLRGGEKDMASHIAATERPDLKRSIGLNDRFLMIRDMFDGDADAFDRAIERLDGFRSLDDAIIHIHDTYEWSADSQGVKLLVELLERKLG